MKKFIMFIAAAFAISGMVTSCSAKNAESKCESDCENCENHCGHVAPLPDTTVVEVLKNDSLLRPDSKVKRLTVIDFNALWCGPCRMLTPSFDAVADTLHGKVDFYSVNVDSMRATADAFGIKGIPTLVILSPTDTVRTYVGLDPYLEGIDIEKIETPEELTTILTPALLKVITGK